MSFIELQLSLLAQFLGLGVAVYGFFYGAGWLVKLFRTFAEED